MKMGIAISLGLWLIIAICVNAAFAGGPDIYIDNSVTNNYYGDEGGSNVTSTDGSMSITNGVSDSDLSSALAMGAAAGSHQFDFSTQDNQMSVSYAMQIDGEEEDAYSIAYARRWDKLGQALLHISYTPEQSSLGDIVVVGGTIRF